MNIDMHMHSIVSDGTDTPEALLAKIRGLGLDVFSLTDHDDSSGCQQIKACLQPDDPLFVPGIEFSTKNGRQKFHILGYACQPDNPALMALITKVRETRLKKAAERMEWLKKGCNFTFSEADVEKLMHLPNPGKPHIARLIVNYGYASSISEAITQYINPLRSQYKSVKPQEAIETILSAGGIPVLAHGIYGSGSQYLTPEELDERVHNLTDLGLMGLECYYSRYTETEQTLTCSLREKYHLLASAGSDYHGSNKTVTLAETHLPDARQDPAVMAFLEACRSRLA